ncbi:MAG: hypothetical protein P8X82_07285 [Gemmatimonadales bacterium]
MKSKIIGLLVLGGRDVAERAEQAVVVEPPDPLEGGEFDVFKPGPEFRARQSVT